MLYSMHLRNWTWMGLLPVLNALITSPRNEGVAAWAT